MGFEDWIEVPRSPIRNRSRRLRRRASPHWGLYSAGTSEKLLSLALAIVFEIDFDLDLLARHTSFRIFDRKHYASFVPILKSSIEMN
ncbi:MAG: hypothetical protein COV44_02895 [Deltaproteobacteria bacterium CG11_big_fil_rev_8_21_14_0_20_45_16]|nr:MAG: hypothetical protein COV44_02895 [Deltaproteobacteria bacterium CG11_big_fil_rev_8_21_14_0_20_45_16]